MNKPGKMKARAILAVVGVRISTIIPFVIGDCQRTLHASVFDPASSVQVGTIHWGCKPGGERAVILTGVINTQQKQWRLTMTRMMIENTLSNPLLRLYMSAGVFASHLVVYAFTLITTTGKRPMKATHHVPDSYGAIQCICNHEVTKKTLRQRWERKAVLRSTRDWPELPQRLI